MSFGPFELAGKRLWVAGHGGFVGQALVRRLSEEPCTVLTTPKSELDLRDQAAVRDWMCRAQPDAVILAAARVGGLTANMRNPATFLYDNLMIQANVIHGAHEAGVRKLVFLGSSASYPHEAPQPIVEEALMTGPLDPAHEGYGTAKIAGIRLCQGYRSEHGRDFVTAQLTNLYGPGDHYGAPNSHVMAALMPRFHAAAQSGAETIDVWGTGTPRREFMHVDDAADALVFMLQHYSGDLALNVGSGEEVTIAELAQHLARVTGCEAQITFDTTKPDGAMRKRLDCRRLTDLGWDHARPLSDGLRDTYDSWRAQLAEQEAAP